MLSIAARTLERRSAIPAARLLHTRSAHLVSEKDGSGAGGAATVVVTPAAATIVTPNTQPNTHYTSSLPRTQPAAAATAPPTPPPQPAPQKPVALSAPPPHSPAPPPPSPSARQPARAASSLRSRLTAFLVGVGLAGGAGYYRLQSDVWSSARALEGQIEGLRVVGAGADSKALADKVAALERRVAELEKDKAKK